MNSVVFDHETTILRELSSTRTVSLERALLVLSGLDTVERIQSYEQKIDLILHRFLSKYDFRDPSHPTSPPFYLHTSIAKNLFQYLWTSKPRRFGEHFLLADVVDAQLGPDAHELVGSCVGLTSLYSILGLRLSLNLFLLVSGDHLLSRLRVGSECIDIDHTDPQGFNTRSYHGFRELPLVTLTANVLNSRGLRHESHGEFGAAKADYQKAILINPEYANAFNNRGNMSLRDGDLSAAIADYSEALRLDPSLCEAYCNRGIACHRLGRLEEARQDYSEALRRDSTYGDARKCLQLLDEIEPGRQ